MRMAIRTDDDRLGSRRYGAPSDPDIAGAIPDESAGKPCDIMISLREGGFYKIADTPPCYDPTQYRMHLFAQWESLGGLSALRTSWCSKT